MLPATFNGQPQRNTAPIRVLLADDEFLLRFDAADGIRRLGWDVVEVSSADEAIELLGFNVRFDLLVTDIHMPGKADGLDLARYVRSHHAHMKIALMSSDRLTDLADVASYDLFMSKPVWKSIDALAALMGDAGHAG